MPCNKPHNIIRIFAKYYYKFTHSNHYKHNRRYWPFYKIERNNQQISKVYFQDHLIADHTIKSKKKHHQCILITTGPSIKNINFSQIPNEFDYIGVNGAIALENINFQHYVIIDHNFINNRFDLVLKVLESACDFYTTTHCLDNILNKISIHQIICKIKIIEIVSNGFTEKIYHAKTPINLENSSYFHHQGYGFSNQIFDCIFDYYTVAYSALQIINALQYTTIYIAGLDMSNFEQPRFYESTTDKQPTHLDQHLDAIHTAFDCAAQYFMRQNIQVYNLSPTNIIHSFEKREVKRLYTSNV